MIGQCSRAATFGTIRRPHRRLLRDTRPHLRLRPVWHGPTTPNSMFLTRLKLRLDLLPAPTSLRTLGTTTPWMQKAMPPRPKPPPDEELEESYLKGSGPGGQKIVPCTRYPGCISRRLTWLSFPEQNQLSGAAEAYSHRNRRQVTGHAVTVTESQACEAAPRGKTRRLAQWRPESERHHHRYSAKEEGQRHQEEPEEIPPAC